MTKLWQKAAEILKDGGVIIIPAEASFGIAARASDSKAVERLYKIKVRENNKPSLVIVDSLQTVKNLVEISPLAQKLIDKFWPGPLTLVFKAKDNQAFSSLIYGADDTLAIRFPSMLSLQQLAKDVGPFILPSANFGGETPPFKFEQIDKRFSELVDYILEEETAGGSEVSTLVDVTSNTPKILREGAISTEHILKLL
jgi:L-threonylcarbamoyladenylate synthase